MSKLLAFIKSLKPQQWGEVIFILLPTLCFIAWPLLWLSGSLAAVIGVGIFQGEFGKIPAYVVLFLAPTIPLYAIAGLVFTTLTPPETWLKKNKLTLSFLIVGSLVIIFGLSLIKNALGDNRPITALAIALPALLGIYKIYMYCFIRRRKKGQK